jgi:ubiquinone/menaquinone biosynthesis C-methylase UbiE
VFENPATVVLPLLKTKDRVLEFGPALGFFTLPVAEALGPDGRLVCVDVQEGMLRRLRRRLEKRGLAGSVEMRQCTHEDLGFVDLEGTCDLVLALHVVHETVSPAGTMKALARCLKPGGYLLLVEPPGHCSPAVFRSEVEAAREQAWSEPRTHSPRVERTSRCGSDLPRPNVTHGFTGSNTRSVRWPS